MSFRVIHHQGDKDLLFQMIKSIAGQIENEYGFDEDEWQEAIDSVINGDFSTSELAPAVLLIAINSNFPPVSEDDCIQAYQDLAEKTSGKLAKTLQMFVDGRNFSTGNLEFGLNGEITCGYLTPDEVKEFLELIKAYALDKEDEEDEEFVNNLIDIFSRLVEKKSGDLFIMN